MPGWPEKVRSGGEVSNSGACGFLPGIQEAGRPPYWVLVPALSLHRLTRPPSHLCAVISFIVGAVLGLEWRDKGAVFRVQLCHLNVREAASVAVNL